MKHSEGKTIPLLAAQLAGVDPCACLLQNLVRQLRIVDRPGENIGSPSYKVLHLPGHSPGSIGLLDEASGIFFSDDAIYDGTLVDDLPGCDKCAYWTTMRRLRDLDASA